MANQSCGVPDLFPALAGITWRRVDLSAVYHRHRGSGGCSDLRTAHMQRDVVLSAQLATATRYVFGGFMENRSAMWRGFEQPPWKHMIHLGVDFMGLLAGTRVAAPCDGTVVHVQADPATFNGWGGRVVLRVRSVIYAVNDKYLLIGHLDPAHLPSAGQVLKKGDLIGYVGTSDTNGGWFEHVHVQIVPRAPADGRWEAVDGYADLCPCDSCGDKERLLALAEDPTVLVTTQSYGHYE